MIYTVTFSPALDYVVDLDELVIGAINRSKKEGMLPGGKGINVSIVLSNLHNESVALGFVGGFVGQYIEDELARRGVKTDFVHLQGNTRINVKVRGKVETAINGQGPKVPQEAIDALMAKLKKLGKGDTLVLAGAIPSTLPSDTYEKILAALQGSGAEVVVDTTKDTLLKCLPYHPLFVKPNQEELEELFGIKIHDKDELIAAAKRVIALGSQNVIVSLGGDGALLVEGSGNTLLLPAPKGKVVNTVGAGDSLVAGFVDAHSRGKSAVEAFKQGICCGSASAFSEDLATYEDVQKLLRELTA